MTVPGTGLQTAAYGDRENGLLPAPSGGLTHQASVPSLSGQTLTMPDQKPMRRPLCGSRNSMRKKANCIIMWAGILFVMAYLVLAGVFIAYDLGRRAKLEGNATAAGTTTAVTAGATLNVSTGGASEPVLVNVLPTPSPEATRQKKRDITKVVGVEVEGVQTESEDSADAPFKKISDNKMPTMEFIMKYLPGYKLPHLPQAATTLQEAADNVHERNRVYSEAREKLRKGEQILLANEDGQVVASLQLTNLTQAELYNQATQETCNIKIGRVKKSMFSPNKLPIIPLEDRQPVPEGHRGATGKANAEEKEPIQQKPDEQEEKPKKEGLRESRHKAKGDKPEDRWYDDNSFREKKEVREDLKKKDRGRQKRHQASASEQAEAIVGEPHFDSIIDEFIRREEAEEARLVAKQANSNIRRVQEETKEARHSHGRAKAEVKTAKSNLRQNRKKTSAEAMWSPYVRRKGQAKDWLPVASAVSKRDAGTDTEIHPSVDLEIPPGLAYEEFQILKAIAHGDDAYALRLARVFWRKQARGSITFDVFEQYMTNLVHTYVPDMRRKLQELQELKKQEQRGHILPVNSTGLAETTRDDEREDELAATALVSSILAALSGEEWQPLIGKRDDVRAAAVDSDGHAVLDAHMKAPEVLNRKDKNKGLKNKGGKHMGWDIGGVPLMIPGHVNHEMEESGNKRNKTLTAPHAGDSYLPEFDELAAIKHGGYGHNGIVDKRDKV